MPTAFREPRDLSGCGGSCWISSSNSFGGTLSRVSTVNAWPPATFTGRKRLRKPVAESTPRKPLLIVTPLTFLGGAFYSINMLPPLWQKITLFNPVVYLISGFRWSFYEISDVNVMVSLGMTLAFLAACMAAIWWIFTTGYRLKA